MRVIDFFDQGVDLYPENLAFVDGDEHLTYAQASEKTHHIASAIRGHGYAKGVKAGVLAPNSNIAFLALLGLFRSEAVWIPINPRNAVDANVDLLDRFDGELMFYHSSYEREAEQIIEAVPGVNEIVCIDKASDRHPSFDTWLDGFETEFEMGEENPDDLLAIFPTGGTTGKSKGVMMAHSGIETMFANFYAHLNYYDDTRHLVVAPMTHSSGLMGCVHFPRGGINQMMAAADPEAILKAIQDDKITHLFLPPTVLYMLLARPDVRDYDYSSLQHFLVGAAPTSLEKLKEAIDVFGPVMTELYGQAEAPASILAKSPWDYMDKDGNINEGRLASAGRPTVFGQVALMDDDGNLMPKGRAGEIVMKSRLVMPGYYKNPEATAEVSQFGWHHTGDVGVMSEDGYVTIVDRKKDMIISGGFNVFPNEIEQVLTGHDAVQDCAVIGVPDEKWGEAVKGVVQLKPGAKASEEELIALSKEELGGVKAPKSIDFIDDLPRSPNGKVLKTELRKQYWEGSGRGVN
jgi:acyl-CoA synthetase (AMP-forming)/AMP-acid ligase II